MHEIVTVKTPPEKNIVEVFENYFGESIQSLSEDSLRKLLPEQFDDLEDRINDFLKSVRDAAHESDTTLLDAVRVRSISTSDPYFHTHYSDETTDQTLRQLALIHKKIAWPAGPVNSRSSRKIAELPLKYTTTAKLMTWVRANELLLRGEVVILCAYPDYNTDTYREDIENVIQALQFRINKIGPFRFCKSLGLNSSEFSDRHDLLNWIVYVALRNLHNANKMGVSLAFLRNESASAYRQLMKYLNCTSFPSVARAQTLLSVHLPKLGSLPDEDFIAFRNESKDFDAYRRAVGELLRGTGSAVEAGVPLEEAFKANLGLIQLTAEILQDKVREKQFGKVFCEGLKKSTISVIASLPDAMITAMKDGAVDFSSLATKFGTRAAIESLFTILFRKRPDKHERRLRFYDLLLDG